VTKGAVMPIDQCHALAKVWYEGRLDGAWRPRSIDEKQAILERVGLVSPFWRLT
jgi:hypothetical protein